MTSSTTSESPPAQLAGALATLLSATMDTEHTEGSTSLTASAHGRSFTISVAEGAATGGGTSRVDTYLAGLRDGDKVTESVYEEHFAPGRDRDRRCYQQDDYGYTCVRKVGHTGVHVATYSGGTLCSNPWAPKPGDTERTVWRGVKRHSRLTAEQANLMGRDDSCYAMDDHGFSCCRTSGHPGPHVATYGLAREGIEVCAVPWGKPWAPAMDDARRDDIDPTGGPDEHDPCGEDIEGDRCTRANRHSGNHVSGNGERVLDWEEP